MRKRIKIVVLLVILILLGVVGFDVFRAQKIKRLVVEHKAPAPYVSSVLARSQTWQPRLLSVGSLVAVNGVTVTTEAPGLVVKIGFGSGDEVEKGQYLIQLDDSLDVQTLKNNQAQLTLTQLDFNRKEKLYRSAAISKSDYDESLAELRKAKAAVESALVQIAQKRITAPFTGRAGIRKVNIGQYLNPGDAIVSLESLDPLYVNFSLPQRELAKVFLGQKLALKIDAFPGETFTGKITAINSRVCEQTRNLEIQGTIPNPQRKLYPGIFADVAVFLPQESHVVTLPQTAVDYSLYGNIAYVLTPAGKNAKGQALYKVQRRVVQIGKQLNNRVAIRSGIQAGEQVVSSGQLKLANDRLVLLNNDIDTQKLNSSQLEGGR